MFAKVGCQLAIAGGLLPAKVLRADSQVLAGHRVALHMAIRQNAFATIVTRFAG